MKKIIKPGQLITVNNIIYRCRKRPDFSFWEKCCSCDLIVECGTSDLKFSCGSCSNFKRVATKTPPKTRRCKKLQK